MCMTGMELKTARLTLPTAEIWCILEICALWMEIVIIMEALRENAV